MINKSGPEIDKEWKGKLREKGERGSGGVKGVKGVDSERVA